MINALGGTWTMNNVGQFIKVGQTKEQFFKFANIELKGRSYNQVVENLVSQRIDRIIETNWDLDFQIKDIVRIGKERYMITNIPNVQKLNLTDYNKLTTLWLVQLVN